jgi:hypothetical protein
MGIFVAPIAVIVVAVPLEIYREKVGEADE